MPSENRFKKCIIFIPPIPFINIYFNKIFLYSFLSVVIYIQFVLLFFEGCWWFCFNILSLFYIKLLIYHQSIELWISFFPSPKNMQYINVFGWPLYICKSIYINYFYWIKFTYWNVKNMWKKKKNIWKYWKKIVSTQML